MLRALCTGLLVVAGACGPSTSIDRPGDPPTAASPRSAAGATPQVGLVGAGALEASGVLLGIIDDPPRVWQRTETGERSWPAPARIGALAAGARTAEVIVAAAWAEARRPRAEVWWLVDGVARRHCVWEAPPLERWRSQPRGASAVLALPDAAVVAGVDGSLVRFDASCAATVLHAEPCCEGERPLHLRGDARAWSAVDAGGRRVYPAGDAVTCVAVVDRGAVRGDGWSTPLPAQASGAQVLDWSEPCDLVLIAAGTGAWTCRAAGCTRVR